MNLSIIVLTYNSSKHLKECLDSILDNMDKRDELIVIDNNSSDSTKDILKTYKNKANIYYCDKNIGISEGRNLGAKLAKNDTLSFIDSDIILEKNSIKNAKESYVKNNAKALFGFFKESGKGYNWFVEMRRELFSTKRKKNFNKVITLKNFTCFLGGLCLIDTHTFNKYGGFDTSFKDYPSEDINLELLMIRDNVKIIFEKSFLGRHLKSNMEFDGLINKFKKNGISLAKLIKSSIKNKYKIPFNSGWPYLPIVAPIEILLLILSFINIYFMIPLFIFIIVKDLYYLILFL